MILSTCRRQKTLAQALVAPAGLPSKESETLSKHREKNLPKRPIRLYSIADRPIDQQRAPRAPRARIQCPRSHNAGSFYSVEALQRWPLFQGDRGPLTQRRASGQMPSSYLPHPPPLLKAERPLKTATDMDNPASSQDRRLPRRVRIG